MKFVASIASLSAALLIAGLVQAAGQPPQPASSAVTAPAATALSLADVHQRLLAAGYREVSELQRKHEHVEAEARDRDGRRVELDLDPVSAAVRRSEFKGDSQRAVLTGLDLGQLLAEVEAAGYRAVRKIEREHDEVEVSADDAQGRRVKLRLDPQTGALKSSGR
jgi:hypothetical protein